MLDSLFDGPGVVALELRLQLLAARRDAIATNLANAETPGYRPFEARLADALDLGQTSVPAAGPGLQADGGSPGPWGSVTAAVELVPEAGGPMRADGNGVDVDAEMARLAQTQLWYEAGTRALQLHFQRLRTSIDAGGS